MHGILLIVCYLAAAVCQEFSKNELQTIFNSQKCIQGSLGNIQLREDYVFGIKDSNIDYQVLKANITKTQEKEKSILSKLNEFSQYIGLDYYFKLLKEEGPPHDRIFTVSLTIGEEQYIGEGKSLKQAQKQAAVSLFENTNYAPAAKDIVENQNVLTPTVLLNNICAKLGFNTKYTVVDKEKEFLQSNIVVNEKTKKSYLERLNNSLYNEKHIHVKKDLPGMKGPFTVKLKVQDNIFYGSAQTIQAAKHEAATKGIDFILENRNNLDTQCIKEGYEAECKKQRNLNKSPISLANEAAQIRDLSLDCEIVGESGPSHRKSFLTQCQIGEVIVTGEGESKKKSKAAAAKNLLDRIEELPPVSKEMQIKSFVRDLDNKSKRRKKKKMIKSSFEEISYLAKQSLNSIFYSENVENGKNHPGSSNNGGKPAKSKQYRSYQDEFRKFAHLLDFDISYTDFEDDGLNFSLLSLSLNPEYLCLGQGVTDTDSRNVAANEALKLLYKLDFKTHLANKHSIESDIKMAVHSILQGDISVQSK